MKIRTIICSIVISILAVSCYDNQEILPLSKDIIEPSSRLVLVDTLGVGVSTVILDSIPTSGKELILAGIYNDPRLGKIISKSYFQVGFPKTLPAKHDVFDSISLLIAYNSYSYGDTTQLQKLGVNRLTDRLQLKEQTAFYNTTSLDYDHTSLGELIFYPRPSSKEKIEIELNKDFGQEIFDYLNQAQDDEFKEDEFNNFFRGLILVPDEMIGNSINGYMVNDTSPLIKLYSHATGDELISKQTTLPLINKNLQFNQITCDWSNCPAFIGHKQKNEIPASETGNVSFINAGLGMYTKFSFPSMQSIVEFENSVLIRAILYIRPALGANVKLPDSKNFGIYQTAKYNVLEFQLLNPDGSAVEPTLSVDALYNEKTWYSLDITDNLISDLSDRYIDPAKALSVTFSASYISNSVDQLLIAGTENKLTKPTLELLFLFYDLN